MWAHWVTAAATATAAAAAEEFSHHQPPSHHAQGYHIPFRVPPHFDLAKDAITSEVTLREYRHSSCIAEG